MNTVYVLQHSHPIANDAEDVKFIGVYSTRQKAQEAVMRMAALPGFVDAPDEFSIDEYQLDQAQWSEGFVTVPAVASRTNGVTTESASQFI